MMKPKNKRLHCTLEFSLYLTKGEIDNEYFCDIYPESFLLSNIYNIYNRRQMPQNGNLGNKNGPTAK